MENAVTKTQVMSWGKIEVTWFRIILFVMNSYEGEHVDGPVCFEDCLEWSSTVTGTWPSHTFRRLIAWDDDLRDRYGALHLRKVGLRRLSSPFASSSSPSSFSLFPSISAHLYADRIRVFARIRHHEGHGRPREDYRC